MANYNRPCVKNIATSALFDKNKSKLKCKNDKCEGAKIT
jgi:hypothetical protein